MRHPGNTWLRSCKRSISPITLGQQGVFLVNHQGEAWHLPAYPVVPANDVGAGDSFASATALALAAGGEVVEAAHIGIEAACIAVSKRWTTPVYLHELRQRFLQREDLPEVVEHAKQKELAELAGELEAARQAGQRIVFTNGIFDILHFGHIRLLRQAKMLGNVLVVGINSDASTRRLKGEGRPINNARSSSMTRTPFSRPRKARVSVLATWIFSSIARPSTIPSQSRK